MCAYVCVCDSVFPKYEIWKANFRHHTGEFIIISIIVSIVILVTDKHSATSDYHFISVVP